MHEYDQIKTELIKVFDNFKLSMKEEDYHSDSFGSAYSTYSYRDKYTYASSGMARMELATSNPNKVIPGLTSAHAFPNLRTKTS